jgi:hypothetical protein
MKGNLSRLKKLENRRTCTIGQIIVIKNERGDYQVPEGVRLHSHIMIVGNPMSVEEWEKKALVQQARLVNEVKSNPNQKENNQ